MRPRSKTVRRARRRLRAVAAGAVLAAVSLFASIAVVAPAHAADVATVTADTGIVKAAPVVGFDPENIISDALFYDSNAMTAAEIQAFLDANIGTCRNSKCLNVLRVNGVDSKAYYSQTTGLLLCGDVAGGSMLVSEWIYRVQKACEISAKVILVTLQKEQGLVTDAAPTDYELLAAMGHECPDTARCNPAVAGPVLQIFKGAQQLKTYKATRFARQPGLHFIGYSPTASCGGTTLNIRNYATAALYNYTPYQPNAASLAAGAGLGDGCSSYGNRNFYRYYTNWFGSTQGRGVCDQPPYEQVRGASGKRVAAADVPARITANEFCNTGAVWLPKGMVVTIAAEWGDWFWVDVNGTKMWMLKAHLAAYDPCTQPPYGEVRGASGTLVTIAVLKARVSANEDCTAGAISLPAGSEVTRSAAWAGWSWVSARGAMYWVKTAQLAAPANDCSQPPYEQVTGATGTFIAIASTARPGPSTACTTGATKVAAGTKVAVSATWGDWYWVKVSGSMLWMRQADLTVAAAANACNQPPYEQVTGASGTFTASASTARQAPNADCANGAVNVAAGTRVTVGAAWNDWYWVNNSGTMLWMRKADLKAVPVCAQPPYEQVRGASGTFATTRAVTVSAAPDASCTTNTKDLPAGTVVTAGAVWGDWYWIALNDKHYWIPKNLLGANVCTQPRYEEVRGASGTRQIASALTGRVAPATACPSGTALPAGASVRLAAEWGDWYWVEAASQMLWVPKAQVVDAGVFVTTTVAVNLRSGPGTSNAILTVLPAGTAVRQVGSSGDWRQVVHGSITGWVSASYVK